MADLMSEINSWNKLIFSNMKLDLKPELEIDMFSTLAGSTCTHPNPGRTARLISKSFSLKTLRLDFTS